MSLTTSEIIGRVSLPNNVPLAGSIIEFRLSGFDTQGVNLIPGLSDADFILDADGNIPAGSRLWRNGQGLRGTRYSVSVRSPDYAIPYYSFHLGEVVVGPLPSYRLGDLLMAGSEQGKRKVVVSGGQISYFSRNGISFTQVLFSSSGRLDVEGESLSGHNTAFGAGGGSNRPGFNRGGGGAGEVRENHLSLQSLTAGSYDVSIGAGGAPGAAGSDSIIARGGVPVLIVKGGGRGGNGGSAGDDGGNGGGAGGNTGSRLGGVGVQNNGGASGGADITPGGGGGAGGPGLPGGPTSGVGGNGGPGIDLTWTEPPLGVGGGGGGGGTASPGTATHGGTNGTSSGRPLDATWSGGAGGGRTSSAQDVAAGGDGFFVIVYPTYMASTEMAA